MVHPLASLALLTVISGAFVAGLDAGMIYNDFPLMGGQLMPSDLIDTQLKPSIRNFTENATTVQFVHRILGISTVLGFTTLFLMARRANSLSLTKSINLMRHSTPNISNKNNFNSGYLGAIKLSTGLAWTQATLGVSTLLGGVPILLASAHQATSLILIASIVHLIRQM